MVRFDTLSKHETEYGHSDFIEVARKLARDETNPEDAGVEFISISRGYRGPKGDRRFKMHFTMPPEPALVEFLKEALEQVGRA